MSDSVIGIAIELYQNPKLMEIMELARGLNKQDLNNVTEYLNKTKETREHESSSKGDH